MSNCDELEINRDDDDVLSAYDELPLWSAPFGFALLNAVNYKKSQTVLDVGSGTGFPVLELAQRLGRSSNLYALDPWKAAMRRAKQKMRVYSINFSFR